MRVVSLGQSQETSTLLELRGTRVLLDAGLSLAASARILQREVGDDDGASKKSKSDNHQRPHTTGKGDFLIAAPAYRTAMFEATDCGAIDAVLATSAAGLLGLPYLVQAAAEAVGGRRGVSAGDPRAGGVMRSSREGKGGSSFSSSSSSSSSSLPPFLDPPFEVFATDLAVDMALAWVAELAASSSAAADAEADADDGIVKEVEEEEDDRRRSGGKRCSSSSASSRSRYRPLAHLPASALAALTERARRDILGESSSRDGGAGDETDTSERLRAWRRAYPAALAAALLSGDNKSRESENGKEDRNGTSCIKGQVVTRVQFGERVRLRGGTLVAVATPAGGSYSPGSAIWTLVDSVAEASASLAACSGRVGVGEEREKGFEEKEGAGAGGETGVARVVCVGAFGGAGATWNSSSAAAPLDVSALRGAHVLVLAPPCDPPPWPLLKAEDNAAAAVSAAPPSSNSSSSSSPLAAAAAAAVAAIESGGNALLPISAGDGRALELVESVLSALYARGGHGLLSRVPCVFASPGAKRSAAAACSSAEWLCAARSALVLSGRAPYFAGPAASAAASVIGGSEQGGGGGGGAAGPRSNNSTSNGGGGGLFVADSLSQARRLHGWRESCVAFVPASSLFNSSGGGGGSGNGSGSGGGGGGGDGAALLRAWGADPRSAVVFTCSSSLPSGARLSQLVSRAHPGIRARIFDAGAEAAAAEAKNASAAASSAMASALCALAAAVSPTVVVAPRAWERAMLRIESTSVAPLGKACGRVEALDPLVPLELAEGEAEDNGEEEEEELVLPRALSRAGVTSELAFAASKIEGEKSLFLSRRVLLALATVRDGGVELDAPPGAAGGAALAAALVVHGGAEKGNKKRRKTTEEDAAAVAAPIPPSSTLDALLCELGAPAVKVE